MILSKESVHISCTDFKMESARRYYVRVRIATEQGKMTDFSEPSTFVSALIHNNEWKAKFISAENEADAAVSKGTYLRKEFRINKKVKEAYAFTTALGLYKLYINGKYRGSDGRSWLV